MGGWQQAQEGERREQRGGTGGGGRCPQRAVDRGLLASCGRKALCLPPASCNGRLCSHYWKGEHGRGTDGFRLLVQHVVAGLLLWGGRLPALPGGRPLGAAVACMHACAHAAVHPACIRVRRSSRASATWPGGAESRGCSGLVPKYPAAVLVGWFAAGHTWPPV